VSVSVGTQPSFVAAVARPLTRIHGDKTKASRVVIPKRRNRGGGRAVGAVERGEESERPDKPAWSRE
jgi:hypothetical protein